MITQKQLAESLHMDSYLTSLRELGVVKDSNGFTHLVFKSGRLAGEKVPTTQRFWNSLCSKFQLAPGTFRYFTHDEVFERVASVKGGANIQIAVEELNDERRVMAVTAPSSSKFDLPNLSKVAGEDALVSYHDGLVTYFREPKSKSEFALLGDEFVNKVALEVPLDGYGKPKAFLSTVRQVCGNGMVAYAPTFTTEISTGKFPWAVLERAFNTYDNPDGFVTIKERLASAQTSYSSIREVQALKSILIKHQMADFLGDLEKVTGSLSQLYGVTNLEVLSDRKRRLFKTNARVYDLINFATELATHHAEDRKAAQLNLQAFVGSLISGEYDLEGTAIEGKKPKFKDFLIAA